VFSLSFAQALTLVKRKEGVSSGLQLRESRETRRDGEIEFKRLNVSIRMCWRERRTDGPGPSLPLSSMARQCQCAGCPHSIDLSPLSVSAIKLGQRQLEVRRGHGRTNGLQEHGVLRGKAMYYFVLVRITLRELIADSLPAYTVPAISVGMGSGIKGFCNSMSLHSLYDQYKLASK
jgi:hypothetical protein